MSGTYNKRRLAKPAPRGLTALMDSLFFCSAGFVDLTAATKGEYAFTMPPVEGGTIFGRAVVNCLSEHKDQRLTWEQILQRCRTVFARPAFRRTVGEHTHKNGFIQNTQTVFKFDLDVKQVGQPAVIKQPEF